MQATQFSTIGVVSAEVGVATHVLRHWESMGVLAPSRAANGHRVYGPQDRAQIQLVQRCQAGGLSLDQVRHILRETGSARRDLLRAHLRGLHARATQVQAAVHLVEHALECTEPSLVDCRACREALSDRATGPASRCWNGHSAALAAVGTAG